jgi:hypothetical protein
MPQARLLFSIRKYGRARKKDRHDFFERFVIVSELEV